MVGAALPWGAACAAGGSSPASAAASAASAAAFAAAASANSWANSAAAVGSNTSNHCMWPSLEVNGDWNGIITTSGAILDSSFAVFE